MDYREKIDQKNAVAQTVRDFYNQTPFPDFELDRFFSKSSLRETAWPFAKALDRCIPKESSVLDVGTGTGQLAALLSLERADVWGIDFSESSLAKAAALKDRLGLHSLTLRRADILDQSHIDAIGRTFDYVLCLGVLHHTADPRGGFAHIARLVKPGGYIAVGLYNTFGRSLHKARIALARTMFQNNKTVRDWFIKMQIGDLSDKERVRGWWNDQYAHPHETTHTIGEVLAWFRENNIIYQGSIPPLGGGSSTSLEIAGIWDKHAQIPSLARRVYAQCTWIGRIHKDGGYWVMCGRRKSL